MSNELKAMIALVAEFNGLEDFEISPENSLLFLNMDATFFADFLIENQKESESKYGVEFKDENVIRSMVDVYRTVRDLSEIILY